MALFGGEDSQALFRSPNLGTWGSDIPIIKCVEMIPKYEEITSQVSNFHLMEESLKGQITRIQISWGNRPKIGAP